MTFDEYFKNRVGKGIDYDGNYGVQCFDLANDYSVKVDGDGKVNVADVALLAAHVKGEKKLK